MKKFLLCISLLLLSSLAFPETVILWFLDDPDVEEIDGSSVKISDLTSRGSSSGLKAEYARIAVTGDSISGTDYLYLSYDQNGWTDTDTSIYIEDMGSYAGPAYANITQYFDASGNYDASMQFMLEVGNYDANNTWIMMAASQAATIDSLNADGHIWSDELHYQGSLEWNGLGYAVPEPNSILMCLFGIGFLLLRRKNI